MSRVDTILKLSEQISAAEQHEPRNEVEIRRLKQLRADLARAEMAARGTGATATAPPLYPVGLGAWFNEFAAEVVQAWYDLGHWNYLIDVSPVPVVGTARANLTEAEAKAELAQRTGMPAGPAYPRGATFRRGGFSGQITEVLTDGDAYLYRVTGRAGTLSETQLRDALNAA